MDEVVSPLSRLQWSTHGQPFSGDAHVYIRGGSRCVRLLSGIGSRVSISSHDIFLAHQEIIRPTYNLGFCHSDCKSYFSHIQDPIAWSGRNVRYPVQKNNSSSRNVHSSSSALVHLEPDLIRTRRHHAPTRGLSHQIPNVAPLPSEPRRGISSSLESRLFSPSPTGCPQQAVGDGHPRPSILLNWS